jgi:hypothetical protein
MEDPPEEGIGVGPGMNTHRAITADRPQRLCEQTDSWLGHLILPSSGANAADSYPPHADPEIWYLFAVFASFAVKCLGS